MKIRKTVCDICGKDITDDMQYRFIGWHYRLGKSKTYHMCSECKLDFRMYVAKKQRGAE